MMVLASPVVILTDAGPLRGFWSFYRRYTETAIHTAAAAALAIFGLLVFVDPWFVAIAIGCYVVPPVVLYALEIEPPGTTDETSSAARDESPERNQTRSAEPAASAVEPGRSRERVGADTDTDADSDAGNGDTDSDSDDGDTDTDSDSDDGDTDSDSDGDDGDTDSDSDS